MEQRKVFDSDVQTVPLLRSIAETYALDYVGDFPMMIECKKVLLAGGTLPDASVRAVLNTLRYDCARADLQAAVGAVLRHPSTPPPEDMAQVIEFDRAKRRAAGEARAAERERKEAMMREVYLRMEPEQFQVKARFATAKFRTKGSVLHWLRPEGHRLEWVLNWHHRRGPGWEEVCRKGSGHEREFHLMPQAFCKQMHHQGHLLWSERPLESDVWPEKGADRFLPDCKSCLRVIGLEFMDVYPPDRLSTGEYPEGWRE